MRAYFAETVNRRRKRTGGDEPLRAMNTLTANAGRMIPICLFGLGIHGDEKDNNIAIHILPIVSEGFLLYTTALPYPLRQVS